MIGRRIIKVGQEKTGNFEVAPRPTSKDEVKSFIGVDSY